MFKPPMRFQIDIFGPDRNLLMQSIGAENEANNPSGSDLLSNPYFSTRFYPETVPIPEIQVVYEEITYRYGTGPLLVFSHTLTTSEQVIFYLYADNKEESKEIMKGIAKLRLLTLPYMLKSKLLMPPPRIWIKVWGAGLVSPQISSTSILNYFFTENVQNGTVVSQSSGAMFAMLAVVESVGFNIISAFQDDSSPRLVETFITFREIIYPYRTLTINEVFNTIKNLFL